MRRIRTLALLLLVTLAAEGCAAGRVAIVDSNRVLNESVRALSYQKRLDEREKAMALDLQLLGSRLPAADLEARRNQYLKELQQMKAELEQQLTKEIHEAVAQVVREKRFRGIVMVKDPILYTSAGRAVDITDEVIAKLK